MSVNVIRKIKKMAKFQDPLDNPEPFQVPKAILNMLEECSPRGYLLAYIDSHDNPQIRIHFPSPISEIGLRTYLQNLLNNMDELDSDEAMRDFIQNNFDFGDTDPDGDDE